MPRPEVDRLEHLFGSAIKQLLKMRVCFRCWFLIESEPVVLLDYRSKTARIISVIKK